MKTEIWKPIAGFEGLYEVSNLGRIRTFDRIVQSHDRWGNRRSFAVPGRILKPGPHPGGYKTVHLYRNGKCRSTVLHIIVAEAFHGPRPSPHHEVRHLDGRKDNCAENNLKWGTKQENEDDKLAHGTRTRGEKSNAAKLSTAQVIEIRSRRGEPQQNLADEFGCTFSNISAIQLRKSWRHV